MLNNILFVLSGIVFIVIGIEFTRALLQGYGAVFDGLSFTPIRFIRPKKAKLSDKLMLLFLTLIFDFVSLGFIFMMLEVLSIWLF